MVNTVTCINKDDRRVTMSFTGVTSITSSGTTRVITVGGTTITITAADWDILATTFTPGDA